MNEALLKQMTGNDKLEVRPLYGKPFDMKMQGKMVLSCNHRPKITGTDEGIWRRIISVPFKAVFKDA